MLEKETNLFSKYFSADCEVYGSYTNLIFTASERGRILYNRSCG